MRAILPILYYSRRMARRTCQRPKLAWNTVANSEALEGGLCGVTTSVVGVARGVCSGRTELAPGEAWRRGRATLGVRVQGGEIFVSEGSKTVIRVFAICVQGTFQLCFPFLVNCLACGAPGLASSS